MKQVCTSIIQPRQYGTGQANVPSRHSTSGGHIQSGHEKLPDYRAEFTITKFRLWMATVKRSTPFRRGRIYSQYGCRPLTYVYIFFKIKHKPHVFNLSAMRAKKNILLFCEVLGPMNNLSEACELHDLSDRSDCFAKSDD